MRASESNTSRIPRSASEPTRARKPNYTRGIGSKLAKTAELDLHLAVISAVTAKYAPGTIWTYEMIADVAGVHRSAIQNIAERTLRKLRHKILFSNTPLMRELREAK